MILLICGTYLQLQGLDGLAQQITSDHEVQLYKLLLLLAQLPLHRTLDMLIPKDDRISLLLQLEELLKVFSVGAFVCLSLSLGLVFVAVGVVKGNADCLVVFVADRREGHGPSRC